VSQTCVPKQISAGDTFKWTVSFSDYPASDGWTLAYAFRNATQKIDISATPNGDSFDVLVAAATTAAYVAGDYSWSAFAEKGSERYTADSGRITILPNLEVDAPVDARSFNRKMLDAINATLQGGSSSVVAEYTIGNRSIKYLTQDELQSAKRLYEQRVAREEGKYPNAYRSRFSRVS